MDSEPSHWGQLPPGWKRRRDMRFEQNLEWLHRLSTGADHDEQWQHAIEEAFQRRCKRDRLLLLTEVT